MQALKEVTTNLFMARQTIGKGQNKFSVNVYVIAGKNGLVFDGGYGDRKVQDSLVKNIKAISNNGTITRALPSHSHWDHFSGLNHLQKKLGLKILATQKQAKVIGSKKEFKKSLWADSVLLNQNGSIIRRPFKRLKKCVTDALFLILLNVRFVSGEIKILDENTTFKINDETWQMIPVPGHCADDIVLYNESRGILLGGDIVLNKITTWLGPPRSNLSDYISSLEHLKALPHLKTIFPAHGGPITEPVQRIQAAIDHRKKRTDILYQMILDTGKKGISFETLFLNFYSEVSFFRKRLLSGWIGVTLEYLVEKQKVYVKKNGSQVLFNAILN